ERVGEPAERGDHAEQRRGAERDRLDADPAPRAPGACTHTPARPPPLPPHPAAADEASRAVARVPSTVERVVSSKTPPPTPGGSSHAASHTWRLKSHRLPHLEAQ